jgi:hypothetical protein
MVIDNRLTRRPSDRLPWSDPILALLVTQLQDEVRVERRQSKRAILNCQVETANSTDLVGDPNCSWQKAPRWNWPVADGLSN